MGQVKSSVPQTQSDVEDVIDDVAQKIAQKENCLALATGESLGQVSSQTLVNMKIIEEAVKIPVLRPLICLDKEEIIKKAKKLGFFEISILPQEDCCSLFVPAHATAAGNMVKIKEFEKKLKLNSFLNQAVKKAETEIFCIQRKSRNSFRN